MNFLEQLVAEWFEYRGFFVRRNVKVGRREKGGYDCELDVVAFDPATRCVLHVEPSMDADTWERRNFRYDKKFEAGRIHIPGIFSHFGELVDIRQIALFGYGGKGTGFVAGGEVMLVSELMADIAQDLRGKKIARQAVPEIYPLLRAVQFTLQFAPRAG
jgi:hypothetical protein